MLAEHGMRSKGRRADLVEGDTVGAAADLAALGLEVAAPDYVDRALTAFLFGDGGGLDQIPGAAYRAVIELFDQQWLGRAPRP